ncbi:hypothetical protein Tco_1190596, partial [Tanacetum coccineum]
YAEFINPTDALEIQRQPYSDDSQEQMRKRYSIVSLLNVNPQHYKVIAALNNQETQQEIPAALKEVENKTYVFQYRFGKKATPQNPAFVLDTAFKPTPHALLTLPISEATTPPSTETMHQITSGIQTPSDKAVGSSSTKDDNQETQGKAEKKTSKPRRQLFSEEQASNKKPRQEQ